MLHISSADQRLLVSHPKETEIHNLQCREPVFLHLIMCLVRGANPAAGVTSGSANHCTTAPPVVTSDVDAVYDSHVGNRARFVSHDVVNFVFSVSIRASPWPSPPCFLLKLCGHYLEILWCCPFYKSVSSLISLAQAEASCRPIWCICLSPNFRIKVPPPTIV